MFLIIVISIAFWFGCGLYGYSLLMDQNYDLFKVGWDNRKKLIYFAKILLGPIFLMWAITEYKATKRYWETISAKPTKAGDQYH